MQLLKNSGFHIQGIQGNFIALEDPACFLRSISEFMDIAWMVLGVAAAMLLFGWAISMIRGANVKIIENIRNLFLIFAILAAVKPMINLIYGDDLFAAGCKTILVPVDSVQKLLATRDAKLSGRIGDTAEVFDIWDSASGDAYLNAMENTDVDAYLGVGMGLSGAGPVSATANALSDAGVQVVGTNAFSRSAATIISRANNHNVVQLASVLDANDIASAREILARNSLRPRGRDNAGGGNVGDRRRDSRYASGYRQHEGLDISAAAGRAVPTLFSGTVSAIRPMHNGLWSMTIRNDNGTTAFMGYVQKADGINVGSRVRAGAVVGYSQNIAIAPQYKNVPNHVHYELWNGNKGNGDIIDPVDLF